MNRKNGKKKKPTSNGLDSKCSFCPLHISIKIFDFK